MPMKAHVELHTICGRDAHAVNAARVQYGWQYAATDWREVIESPLIDIIDVCTSNVTHTEIATAAAKAGKHVICEKPLALNVADAEKMVAAVRKTRVKNMVVFNYRRVPAIGLHLHRAQQPAVMVVQLRQRPALRAGVALEHRVVRVAGDAGHLAPAGVVLHGRENAAVGNAEAA